MSSAIDMLWILRKSTAYHVCNVRKMDKRRVYKDHALFRFSNCQKKSLIKMVLYDNMAIYYSH